MKKLENGSVQFINGQVESVESQARYERICKECETIFDKEPKQQERIVSNKRAYYGAIVKNKRRIKRLA